MGLILQGECVTPGQARGEVLFSREPISFCYGVDPATGRVADARHELAGVSLAGKILAFPFAKGSSGAGLVILEMVRNNLAPAAIVNLHTEAVLASGPIISRRFYKKDVPVMCLKEADFARLADARTASLDAGRGRLEILS